MPHAGQQDAQPAPLPAGLPHPVSLRCFCWTRVGPGAALHRPGTGRAELRVGSPSPPLRLVPPLRLLLGLPSPSWLAPGCFSPPQLCEASVAAVGRVRPLRVGGPGCVTRGPLLEENTVWILPYGSPSGCPVPTFSQCPWVSASTVWLEPRRSVSLAAREPLQESFTQNGTPPRHCQGCPGACLWEQFSGNPTAGLLRAGTASLVLPSLTVSTEYLCVSPCSAPGMVLSVGIYVWTVQPRLQGLMVQSGMSVLCLTLYL